MSIPEDFELVDIPDGFEEVGAKAPPSFLKRLGTALHTANEQAANLIDTGISLPAGALAGLFSEEERDKVFREMDERKKTRLKNANPDNMELGTTEKVLGAIGTLPVQLLGFPFSPADTGTTMVQEGESLPRALAGTAIDTVGNMVGVALPGAIGVTRGGKIVSGALINAGQDVATRSAIAGVAEKDSTKELLGPSLDSALTSAVIGGGLGGISPSARTRPVQDIKIPDGFEEIAPVGHRVEDIPQNIRDQQAAYNRGLGQPEPEVAVDHSRQTELPFDDGVETMALNRPNNLQRDMFVEDDLRQRQHDPYKESQQIEAEAQARQQMFDSEAQAKLDLEQAPTSRPDISQEIEAAYAQREQAAKQQEAATKAAQQEDLLQAVEERLREDAYVPPTKESLRASRGRMRAGERGAILWENNPRVVDLFYKLIKKETLTSREQSLVNQLKQEDYLGFDTPAQAIKALIEDPEGYHPVTPNLKRAATMLGGLSGKQRGGIDYNLLTLGMGGFTERLKNIMGGSPEAPKSIQHIVKNNLIPKDPPASEIVANALKEGKDTNSWNITKYTASGGSLEAATRKSGLVRDVSRVVQNAQKKADLFINKTVLPLENKFHSMTMGNILALADALKLEMFTQKLLSSEELQRMGLDEKQLEAYASFRQLRKDTLEVQNTAREQLGLKPITELEYSIASRWKGDFRQPVYNKEGKLVWYLAAETRSALHRQAAVLKEQFPELVIDSKKAHTVKSSTNKNDLQAMYTTLLDVLGRDDPAVAKLKEAYEASVATETGNVAGQQKHFERKGNIRGFVGDRPGTSPKKEALAMFQEQVQYAKNAYKWAAMQEAGANLKEVFSNEKLQEQQPKNLEYAKEYFKNNLGRGEAKWVGAIEDALKESAGISPAVVDKVLGGAKSFFITQKLALNAGYTIANILQVVNTVPHVMDILVKSGGNPLKALISGMPAGVAMASGHYLSKRGVDFTKAMPDLPFYKEAFKYAEDNGVTSRSIYDESPIEGRGVVNRSMELLGKTMTIPETYVRSAAYMTFVEMLRSTGKYTDNSSLFQKAEELTNMSMVDYRAGERPMMFSKLGVAGNFLNTLQTYPINLMNQYRYFGKEFARGNPLPLLTMLTIQGAMAGVSGIPGFNDLDKLLAWAKQFVPDSQYDKVADFDPKLWILENLGESAVYGVVSDKSGVGMTSRLSAPGMADMAQAPGGPIGDIAKQAGKAGQLIANPNMQNLAEAALASAPSGLQGLLETTVFKDQTSVPRQDGTRVYGKVTDLNSRQGQVARTATDTSIRKMGLRSQKEVLEKDLNYKTRAIQADVQKRSKDLTEKFYDAVRDGDMKKAGELQSLYTRLNGTAISNEMYENQLIQEYTTVLERQSISAKEKLQAIRGLARINRIKENAN
jgi:hypothetical protein